MQLSGMPRFSIIVPVYNVEKYLGECLESIAAQDFEDYEIVIVDDGSTDESAAVYSRFAAEADARVRIVKQENKGLLAARRTGIAASQGEYLCHVDGDDALAPHALRAINDEIGKTGADLVIIGASDTIDFGSLLPGLVPGDQELYEFEGVNVVRSAFLSGAIPSMWLKIAKRTCVDVDRDYDEYGKLQLGEDQLQSLYILDAVKSVACIRKPLYYYRPNASSITARYRQGQTADFLAVKEAVYSQALAWDEKWPGHSFAQIALAGYLANAYYDMRKNADAKQFRKQFRELRETSLYTASIGLYNSLRFEQKIFYSLLNKKSDQLAYSWLLVCRAATPIVRAVAR